PGLRRSHLGDHRVVGRGGPLRSRGRGGAGRGGARPGPGPRFASRGERPAGDRPTGGSSTAEPLACGSQSTRGAIMTNARPSDPDPAQSPDVDDTGSAPAGVTPDSDSTSLQSDSAAR